MITAEDGIAFWLVISFCKIYYNASGESYDPIYVRRRKIMRVCNCRRLCAIVGILQGVINCSAISNFVGRGMVVVARMEILWSGYSKQLYGRRTSDWAEIQYTVNCNHNPIYKSIRDHWRTPIRGDLDGPASRIARISGVSMFFYFFLNGAMTQSSPTDQVVVYTTSHQPWCLKLYEPSSEHFQIISFQLENVIICFWHTSTEDFSKCISGLHSTLRPRDALLGRMLSWVCSPG